MNVPAALFFAGAVLLLGVSVVGLLRWPYARAATVTTSAPTGATAPSSTSPAATPATPATLPPVPATTAVQAPTPVGMAWPHAGGLIVNTSGVDPIGFGKQLRADGFGWIALRIADGTTVYPPPAAWIQQFRASSGLPVGAWSVLRDDPVAEAQTAAGVIASGHFDFYIANAETEYGYTIGGRQSPATFARSSAFVSAFRAIEPSLPAALASFCRPDQHDLDWSSWAKAGFDFLPEAYVNQLSDDATPSACVAAASRWFPRARIHPLLGVYPSTYPTPSTTDYAQMLARAHTLGFALYPAEDGTTMWDGFAPLLAKLNIATRPSG